MDFTGIKALNLTPQAITAVRDLLTKRNLPGYGLRVFISGSGCTGLQYGMSLEQNISPEDLVFEFDDIKVIIDRISLEYMQGSTIGFIDDVTGSGFKIDNPNSFSTCNCGNQNQNTNNEDDSGCGCN